MSDMSKEQQVNAQYGNAASFCSEMMQKMTGQYQKDNPCAELMSQCFDPNECGDEFVETMSQMMTSCCGSSEEAEADSQQA